MKTAHLTFNASGAAEGAKRGDVVVVVDIIDMSTSAEVAIESGAAAVFGAAPAGCRVPVAVNPERMGFIAGETALKYNTQLIVVAEPRYGEEKERQRRIEAAVAGVARAGAEVSQVIPNIGTEIIKLTSFTDKVVLIISDTGGVAFDAAYNNGAPSVLTATVTRTPLKKGIEPAKTGIERAIMHAQRYNCGVTITAASSNSMEDVLAGQYLLQLLVNNGFLNLP